MGNRLTASEAAFAPILREIGNRGLIYVDDGTSPKSLAEQIAATAGSGFAKANLVLDAVPSAVEIDRALAKLEGLARQNGMAMGFATAWPVVIERIARWSKTVEGRGFSLVPIRPRPAANRVDDFGSQRAPMSRFEDLPYRPCVGLAVINPAGHVFIGRRSSGPEHIDETHVWQMPQGGIDAGEDPWPAGLRELYEETSIRSIERLGEIADWLTYDIPREIVGQAWGGRYRGQTQKWYALRFTGDDREVDIATPGGGAHEPEFIAWRWEPMERLPDLVVPFKRPVYERVVREFGRFTKV
jgi:putative (di)nucleoside polyphosphate hydrolase